MDSAFVNLLTTLSGIVMRKNRLLIECSVLLAAAILIFSQAIAIRAIKAENRSLRAELALNLPQPVSAPSQQDTNSRLASEQFRELLRLRGEVSRLRRLEADQNQKLNEQRQLAFKKLPEAEEKLKRLGVLHSEGVLSASELNKANLEVQLLAAEVKGASEIEKNKIKLQFAEQDLARFTELHKAGVISQTEFEKASATVQTLKASLAK